MSYWDKVTRERIARRRLLKSGAAFSLGAAALALVGCGDDDDSNGGDGGGTPSSPATGALSSPTAVQGEPKPGGSFVMQNSGYHNGLLLARPTASTSTISGLVHSGLLAFTFGQPPSNGVDVEFEPDLAEGLPEQPDELTYVYTLRQAQFHDGKTVTAEDVRYSFERYASPESSRASAYTWLDQVQAPDAQTVVVKSKLPFADGVGSLAPHNDAFIMSKEFEEGPDVANMMMGSGPFMWVSDTAPVQTVLKKNPNYHLDGLPYLDEVTVLGQSDPAKQVADFASGQVDLTYWQSEEQRDEMLRARPDAVHWSYPNPSNTFRMRTDQAPFNDVRVRQTLSMAIDRQKVREAVAKGEGEDDMYVVSHTFGPGLGLKPPGELKAAKNFTHDVQTAKQLLEAVGVDLPLRFPVAHWDISITGPSVPDTATLTQAMWAAAGIAEVDIRVVDLATYSSTVARGDYEGGYFGPVGNPPVFGTYFHTRFWSPPEGVTAPTINTSHVNDQELSGLLDKQNQQLDFDERKQTLLEIQELMAEQMYEIPYNTYSLNYFTNPKMVNLVVPYYRYAGSANYVKYWGLS